MTRDNDAPPLTTSFLPSAHGFPFPNAWEDRTLEFKVAGRPFTFSLRGRCGGMAFAALDYYRSGEMAFALGGERVPEHGSLLARYIWRRQVDSLAGAFAQNMRKFYAWTLIPTGTRAGTAALTRRHELGNVLVAMRAGRPVPLGLVTADRLGGIGLNHQVVACAATRADDALRIHVYDPNYPLRDDVVLDVAWRGTDPVEQRVGQKVVRQWRGLFVEAYRAKEPPAVDEVARSASP